MQKNSLFAQRLKSLGKRKLKTNIFTKQEKILDVLET
jgi:hypothetical protein